VLTLPTNFETRLTYTVNGGLRMSGVVVYELELAAGTLYYSSQAVTWNAHNYTRLAVSQSPIIETMGTRVPECRVTFSNVNNTLRSYLEPDDLISNRRMTIRLLVRNLSTGAFETGSVVLFKGFMQAPKRWDQSSVEITVVGLASGCLAMVPQRATTEWCNVHEFADAVDCNYVSTTTAVGAGSGSTALTVADGTNLVNGQYITIGAGDEVAISSGGGTANITLAEARTWSDTDAVAYSRCGRDYTSCTYRDRQHEFQGFRGRINEQLIRLNYGRTFQRHWVARSMLGPEYTFHRVGYQTRYYITDRIGESESLSDHSRFIPVVLGRRLVDVGSSLIEEASFQYTGDTDGRTFLVRFYALGEGAINELKAWYAGEEIGDEVEESDPIAKVFGSYWRDGSIGADDDETEAEYIADSTTLQRDQNRDWMSVANDPYSRTAYLVLIQENTEDNDNDKIPSPSADVEGLKIQKYTDADTPTTSGSPVFTTNPIWQATALYLSQRFGAGRWVSTADISFPVTQPAAVRCDTAQDGPVATVTANSGASTTYTVDSTRDFQRGMTVEYDDGVTPHSYVVTRILSDTSLELDTAHAQTIGDTITQKLPRYSCNLVLDRPEKCADAVARLMKHCLGYITSDVTGRIELRVEQTGSSVATFKDTGYASGYGIVKDSFEMLSPEEGRYKASTNRVLVSFTDQDNNSDDVHASDHDNIASYGVVAEQLDFEGIDNPHTARQLATTHLGLRRDLKNGARFTVGPIGAKIQPGDIISVTHSVPNWTAADKRVIRTEKIGLGSNEDLLVRLTVEDYQADPYDDITAEQRTVAAISAPTFTLTADTVANGQVILTWVDSSGNAPLRSWSVFKSTSTHGGAPSLSNRIYTTLNPEGATTRRYVYTALDAEYGDTLYFVVRGWSLGGGFVVSNEVTAVPVDNDPSGTQFLPGVNTVYDGDFDEPFMWTTIAPTGATVNPEADSSATAAWTNPDKAYDGDSNDPATATADSGTPYRDMTIYFDVTTGATTGYWKILAKIDDKTTSSSGSLRLSYKEPGTGRQKTIVYLEGGVGGESSWYESPIFTSTYQYINCMAVVNNNDPSTGDVDAWVYEAEWHTTTSTYYSSVGGRQGSLKGDGSSNYGDLRRPWPGRFGDSSAVIPLGSEWIVKLQAQHWGTTPSHDLLVQLYDVDADSYYTLMTIDKDDLSSSLQAFAIKWTAPAEYTGPFEIVVRSLGDADMTIDKLQFYLGDTILGFALHRDEVDKNIDYQTGKEDGYTRGAWDGTVKISSISTS